MSQADDQKRIAALLREREGYARFDRKDRLRDVDAELKRLGHEPEKAETKERAGRESVQVTADDAKPAVKAEAAPVKKAAEPRKGFGK
jgi:hypothetical protein